MNATTTPTDDRPGTGARQVFSRHRNLFTALGLMLLAWLIYLPSIQYGYVYYDDVRILRDHPELYGQASLAADLKGIFVTGFPREEPLLARDVAWAVEGRVFGFDNPTGYHLVNVLLHGAVVACLFLFLAGTTRRYGFALLVSAAFLLLAVHVEPVAWIMGSKDIWSALFMLLALCAQTRRLTATSAAGQAGWYAVTLLCFVVALLSKISVLTFPLVLLLHALFLPWLRGERAPAAAFAWNRALIREVALVLPALAVSSGIYVWYQRTLAQMGIFERGYSAHGLAHLWNLLMVNPPGFWLYLRQIFFPSELAVIYPWPEIETEYAPWQVAVSLLTVAGVLIAGLWLFLRRKDLFFYLAVFFVLMIPYLNLIYIGIWVADRYVYFSSFCVLAIAVSLAGNIWQRAAKALQLGILLLVATMAVCNVGQTLGYQPAWRNGETLWQHHLAESRHAPKDYDNLAAYYYADFGEAIARQDELRMASALHKMTIAVDAGLAEYWPDRNQAPPATTYFLFFLRSLIEEVEGKPEAALGSLLTADRLRPGFDSTNLNLARLYHKLARAATDPRQKADYARAAQDRYKKYIALEFHGRVATSEVQNELAELEQDCPAASQPVEK
ncbi:MAG: hypothetical protein P4N60_19015 [Verrucomicrobiae bacterium]|nr:hypothetical protein [Verrucomicrobiae bacterium]